MPSSPPPLKMLMVTFLRVQQNFLRNQLVSMIRYIHVVEIDLGSNFTKVISRINKCGLSSRGSSSKKGTYFELCIYIAVFLFFAESEESLYTRQNQSRLMPTLHLSQAVVNIPL